MGFGGGGSMIQDFRAADKDGAGLARLVVDWREYSAIERLGDWDNLSGDEFSIPIIYEPV
ncbi:MAG: hypothetical protein PHS14_03695 [Elusimicrobia bacterium]|nr:hypothetical protein [Elusimicrobiota bacterium]